VTHDARWIASFLRQPEDSGEPSQSDLEALCRRKDVRVLPLQRQAHSLLAELPGLGTVDYTTGNGGASCTLREQVQDLRPSTEGTVVFGASGGLRWLDRSWQHSMAVLNQGRDFTDTPPCLLLYGETGELAHQITLPDPGTWEGFIELVCRHRGCWNCLRSRSEAAGPARAAACPAWLLKEAWLEATSERDLDLRLEALGLNRGTAIRALEGLCAAPVARLELGSLLREVTESGLSLQVRLGNRHCTQMLEARFESFATEDRDWEIQMAQASLTLHPDRIARTWRVSQRRAGVERVRIECYDADDHQVLALSGPEDPDPGAQEAWQRLLGHLEAGPSH